MDKNRKLRRMAILLFSAAVIVLPPVLYSRLMVTGTEASFMYGNDRFFLVGVVSVLGGVGIWNLFGSISAQKEEISEEAEDICQTEEQEEDAEDYSVTMEEYPELFLKKEEETAENVSATPSYYEALTAALNAQKTEYAEPEQVTVGEADEPDEIDRFLFAEKKEQPELEDWFDLPDTLPEGYKAYEEADEEDTDDEPENEELEDSGDTVSGGSFARILKKVLIAILLVAIPFGFATVISRFRTDYYADGLKVSGLGEVKSYSWEDCVSYELSPSFFGNQLSFVLTMKDGATVELLPSNYVVSGDGFDSVYAYAAYVGEILDTKGAEKHVRERNTIEQGFADSDDAGEYVRKLID